MRCVHLTSSVAEEASGPTYSVVRLSESIIANNVDVRLLSLSSSPNSSSLPYLNLFPPGFGPHRLGRSPAMFNWLKRQATELQINILHSHSMWMMPNVYPGWISKIYGIPYVHSPRGTLSEWAFNFGSPVKKLFWPLIQKPSLESVNCFHATAYTEYEDIRRLGFSQPVAIIPNGIDMPPPLPKFYSSQRTLLFLGRVHPKKGLDLLLAAWCQVQDKYKDWNLRIVGPDNDGYLIKMKKMASRLNLERVIFDDVLYGMDKWEAYQNSDLFVLPTYSENFGMVVAEALSSGVPAIVTKGAPWEGLETRGAGWWIDIGVDPLVACLNQVLSLPRVTLESMGNRGKVWMQNDYSWKIIGARMTETYSWLSGRADKPNFVFD